ncbi:aspartate:alanine exchanger family transporter [Corynebacterium cystitidis]|uniref:aspartate:alanine exchanger family transporter n=1 Tax=Corynebacterium cystitidis TaxID=35757 RepID=UPI00211DEAEA|nr:TrkA C-terminal domain-containing protein [Corynebacterium cystitidis]
MIDFLQNNALLTIFIVIGLGTAFGAIPFGPIKFGAAGALFIGLFVGAIIELPEAVLATLQDLGLGLFVYMIGLEAGESFFKNIRKQFGLMAMSIVSIILAAVTAVLVGGLLGVAREVSVGAFAGAMTSTPSLSLAQVQTGSDLPAVGYSIGYPTGIVVAILLVFVTIGKNWKASRDEDDSAGSQLRGVRLAVRHPVTSEELVEEFGSNITAGVRRHNGKIEILDSTFELSPGDTVFMMVKEGVREDLVKRVGRPLQPLSRRLPQLTVQKFSVSNQDIGGNRLDNLPLYAKFGAQTLRIRRGDEEILATDDVTIASGDVIEVIVPTRNVTRLESYLGNSIQVANELDWVASATGLALGFILAVIPFPLPGGASFVIGAAGGPLISGLVLGALNRTGRIAWQLPRSANYAIRQFGLMLFLASVGTASGPAFASTAFSLDGLLTIGIAAVIGLVGCGSLLLMAWAFGQSAGRANGAVAGLLGQPAVLQYALQNSSDNRIMDGYSTTFAVALIFKIVVIPFMLV